MTQKQSPDKPVETLLQTIDPTGIADESLRLTVEILLNLIEELKAETEELRVENQKLRDENNHLKGEKGKPDIKANKTSGFKKDHSSEKERKTPSKHTKSSKNALIKIDRKWILEYPESELPADAEFKGYEKVIVQDILLKTDNVLFLKPKFYSPSEGKTYLASLPAGYDGEFGPGIKAFVMSLYYGGNMTQGKLLEFLENIGISMSAGYLSNLLIKNIDYFESEFNEVYVSGLSSTTWQHLDQTSARVKGVNHTTNVICNPLYTVYSTTLKKGRLSVLGVLQNNQKLQFILNELTYELLDSLNLPTKWSNRLKLLPQETVFTELEFYSLLDRDLKKLGSQYRTRVLEAAAIAFYHQQDKIPVVQTLVCDDAPQFKLLTDLLALCWVHEGRHYKKLSPFVACHQVILDEFLNDFWIYYRELLAYRDFPTQEKQLELKSRFWELFGTVSGYKQLDERKKLTIAKASELLLVLENPELPLHNNPAELAARTMVQRRNISYATQNEDGTKAWDIFMSLVATTRKLGISFFEYMQDRISQKSQIPSLGTIIRDKCFSPHQPMSCQEELLCMSG
jgi:regulator of replication initiation timing